MTDYLSLSPYWWPDPEKDDGLPWIRHDGRTNPDSKTNASDSVRVGHFTRSVRALALAYYFSGEEQYAERAIEYVRTWYLNPETRMNPNVNFGQGVPGRADGRRGGIIDTRTFADRMLDSFAILAQSENWTDTDQKQLDVWLGEYLWNFEAENGASLETGIQLLVDYQDPSTEWPWAERGEPRRLRMLPVYRKAAIAWDDEKLMDLSAEGDFSEITVKSNLAEVWAQREIELLYPVM